MPPIPVCSSRLVLQCSALHCILQVECESGDVGLTICLQMILAVCSVQCAVCSGVSIYLGMIVQSEVCSAQCEVSTAQRAESVQCAT